MSEVYFSTYQRLLIVWYEGLIYKIKCIGVTGLPLELIQSFLSHRFQRVVLNGQSSTWLPVTAGVPQVLILGLFLFLIYINDLSNNLSSKTKLFADDTSLFSVVNDVNLSEFHLNSDLKKYLNGLINGKYLSILIFLSRLKKLYFQEKLSAVLFNEIPVACCSTHKHLGMYLDEKLNFEESPQTKKIVRTTKV